MGIIIIILYNMMGITLIDSTLSHMMVICWPILPQLLRLVLSSISWQQP